MITGYFQSPLLVYGVDESSQACMVSRSVHEPFLYHQATGKDSLSLHAALKVQI